MKCKECIHSNVCANNSIIETKYVKNELLICPDYEPAKLFYKMPFPEGTPGQIVIHAHWYKDKNTNLYKCSNCHKYATYPFANSKVWEQCKSMYCPTCGARMDEE